MTGEAVSSPKKGRRLIGWGLLGMLMVIEGILVYYLLSVTPATLMIK
jgi:hypothetical protein